jgi:bifunctional non-homologous end joining protein LigD
MKDRPDQWLLIKAKDEQADEDWRLEQVHGARSNGKPAAKSAKRAAKSAKTSKASKSSRAKKSATSAKRARPSKTTRKRSTASDTPEGEPAPFPGFIQPMLATLVDRPFSDADWLFETKWDGVRALAYLDGGRVRFVSRNDKDMSARYPELAGLAKAVRAQQAVLDGEIVALDEEGRSSFQRLQARVGLQDKSEIERLARSQPVVFYAFDVLYHDGHDLRALPLLERKARLEEIVQPGQRVRLSPHVREDGHAAFEKAQAQSLEGLIAKRFDSPYASGRAGDWLKIKTILRQEVAAH